MTIAPQIMISEISNGSESVAIRIGFNRIVFAVPPIIPRPSRDLVNLRVGVGVGIGPLELALFANNLFDENSPNLIGPLGTIHENIEQRPRVVGVSANVGF